MSPAFGSHHPPPKTGNAHASIGADAPWFAAHRCAVQQPPKTILVLEPNENELSLALLGHLNEADLPWKVLRTSQVDQAVALAKKQAVDVFIGDVRLLQDQGPRWLQEVRRLSPQALRFLVCNSTDQDTVLRAMNVAHRVILKPYRLESIVEAVARTDALHGFVCSERARTLVGSMGTLPPAPRVYLRLTEALQDPRWGAQYVADIICQDPALAAKVLHLCNSAFFSPGHPIANINAAVVRLGLRTIRHLVLASEVFSNSQTPPAQIEALRRCALLTSVLAPLVLDHWADAELARTAGLLANVGKMLPGIAALRDAQPHIDAEAGALLLAHWGLPDPIVEAVAFHRHPQNAAEGGFGLVGAVHVAASLIYDEALDEQYLRTLGLLDKVGEWRKLMHELTAMA